MSSSKIHNWLLIVLSVLLCATLAVAPERAHSQQNPIPEATWRCVKNPTSREEVAKTNRHYLWRIDESEGVSEYQITRGKFRRCGVVFVSKSVSPPRMLMFIGDLGFPMTSELRNEYEDALNHCIGLSSTSEKDMCFNEGHDKLAQRSVIVFFNPISKAGNSGRRPSELFCAPFGCFTQEGKVSE